MVVDYHLTGDLCNEVLGKPAGYNVVKEPGKLAEEVNWDGQLRYCWNKSQQYCDLDEQSNEK